MFQLDYIRVILLTVKYQQQEDNDGVMDEGTSQVHIYTLADQLPYETRVKIQG